MHRNVLEGVLDMTKGPCLCGDPYCPSCGDPSLAVLEEAAERLMEALHKADCSPEFYNFLTESAPFFYTQLEKWVQTKVAEIRADEGHYISYLEAKIDSLKGDAE